MMMTRRETRGGAQRPSRAGAQPAKLQRGRRLVALLTVAAIACLSLFLSVGTAQADPPKQNDAGGDILVIGDESATSIGQSVKSKFENRTVTIEGQKGRQTSDVVSTLQSRKDSLPNVIIISVGSNDAMDKEAFKSRVKQIMDIVGDGRNVYFVNSPKDGYGDMNAALQDVAKDKSNLKVIDAASLVKQSPANQAPDNAHLSTKGYEALGKDLSQTIGADSASAAAQQQQQANQQNQGEKSGFEAVLVWIATLPAEAIAWLQRAINFADTPKMVGDKWYMGRYGTMVQLGLLVLAPMVLVAMIHAVIKGSLQLLIRSLVVYVPVAIFGAVFAVQVVDLLLKITDDFCQVFLDGMQADSIRFFNNTANGFKTFANLQWAILCIVMAFLIFCSAIVLYIMLVLREASVLIATSFLPIGFAMLVWPSTSKYFRSMAQFLGAMIVSKLAMVAGIAFVTAAAAGLSGASSNKPTTVQINGTNVTQAAAPQNTDGGSQDGWVWAANAASVVAMYFTVGVAPMKFAKMMTDMTTDMGQHIASNLRRPNLSNAAQLIWAYRTFDTGKQIFQGIPSNFKDWRRARDRDLSSGELRLAGMGIYKSKDGHGRLNRANHGYAITAQDLSVLSIDRMDPVRDAALKSEIMRLSNSSDVTDVARAHVALDMARKGELTDIVNTGRTAGVVLRGTYQDPSGSGATLTKEVVFADLGNGQVNYIDPKATRRMVDEEIPHADSLEVVTGVLQDERQRQFSNSEISLLKDYKSLQKRYDPDRVKFHRSISHASASYFGGG